MPFGDGCNCDRIRRSNRTEPNRTHSNHFHTHIKQFKSSKFTNNKNNMKNNGHLIRAINIKLKTKTHSKPNVLFIRCIYIYFPRKLCTNKMLGSLFKLWLICAPFLLSFICSLFSFSLSVSMFNFSVVNVLLFSFSFRQNYCMFMFSIQQCHFTWNIIYDHKHDLEFCSR